MPTCQAYQCANSYLYLAIEKKRSSRPETFLEKGVLKKYATNLQENTHAEV